MQRPTCTGLRVRSPTDAQVIFHAVSLNILPMVNRRLDTEERRAISSGSVFVWEERGPNSEATGVSSLTARSSAMTDIAQLGIERWTDGIRWGPSRVRDVSHQRNRVMACCLTLTLLFTGISVLSREGSRTHGHGRNIRIGDIVSSPLDFDVET
jgi:hypothetical protein